MGLLYNYVKIQWQLGTYGPEQMTICVAMKYVTQAEADEIMAIPQVPPEAGEI